MLFGISKEYRGCIHRSREDRVISAVIKVSFTHKSVKDVLRDVDKKNTVTVHMKRYRESTGPSDDSVGSDWASGGTHGSGTL